MAPTSYRQEFFMTETTPGGKIIVPLVVLAAVIAVAWVWMGKPNTSSVPDLTEAAISSAAVAPAAGTETPPPALAPDGDTLEEEAAEDGAAPADAVVGAPADAPAATGVVPPTHTPMDGTVVTPVAPEASTPPDATVKTMTDGMPATPAEAPTPATTP
jgi:hypothetical protein